MKAKELLRRYRNGERDFQGVDLSGESLRDFNLTGIDLSEANLNQTDLRGTRFSNAKLIGTQCCEARTGTQRRWMLIIVAFPLIFLGIAASLLGAFIATFLVIIIEPSGRMTGFIIGDIVVGLVGLSIVAISLYSNYRQGILATLGTGAFAGALAIALAFAVTIAADTVTTNIDGAFAIAVTGSIAIAVIVATALAGTIAFAFTNIFSNVLALAGALIGALTGALAIAVGQGSSNTPFIVIIFTVILVLPVTVLNFLISHRTLAGDLRDKLIRDLAVWIASLGSSNFRKANLTDTNFSYAILKGAHFRDAILSHTRFHLSQKLHLSRVYKTILANRTVLNLLVSLRPEPDKSYVGLNLKGANLKGAELADLDLTETDLSGANLEGADLQRVNLTKVQALGTNFHQANLTATCLEAWNIDSTTQLDGAICEHVYLLRNQQERGPNSGSFAPGEFTKLFEEILNTIDLIFRDGIDWRAFLQTFQTLQVQHEGAALEIQSIENKGDGVMVVRLNASPDADKPAIH
ncbi:MAG: pentapeptide repeat-containing protein [Cyanobacteria bacterium P01_G01_bin.38]